MANEDTTNSDPQGQSAQPTNQDPSIQDGKSIDDQLPEKFKGKNATEIAKSYLDLEKRLGEQSDYKQTKQELAEKRQTLDQYQALDKIISANPALYKLVEEEVRKRSIQPLNPQQQPVDRLERDVTDTKLATQSQIFNNFEIRFGINDLSTEEQNTIKSRIGKELMEMRGAKDTPSAIASIPLDSLPSFLEKAYKLAISDDEKERARVKGMIEARRNSQASFGNMPSSNTQTNQGELTSEQKRVADRLGVPHAKYLKNLQDYQ